jgi:hypothetical protein
MLGASYWETLPEYKEKAPIKCPHLMSGQLRSVRGIAPANRHRKSIGFCAGNELWLPGTRLCTRLQLGERIGPAQSLKPRKVTIRRLQNAAVVDS